MAKDTTDVYRCDCNIIHEEVVDAVKHKMPEE